MSTRPTPIGHEYVGVVEAVGAGYIRVQNADGTLLATPEQPDDAMIPNILALSDVMCTG